MKLCENISFSWQLKLWYLFCRTLWNSMKSNWYTSNENCGLYFVSFLFDLDDEVMQVGFCALTQQYSSLALLPSKMLIVLLVRSLMLWCLLFYISSVFWAPVSDLWGCWLLMSAHQKAPTLRKKTSEVELGQQQLQMCLFPTPLWLHSITFILCAIL